MELDTQYQPCIKDFPRTYWLSKKKSYSLIDVILIQRNATKTTMKQNAFLHTHASRTKIHLKGRKENPKIRYDLFTLPPLHHHHLT